MFSNLSKTLDSIFQDPSFFQDIEKQFSESNPFQDIEKQFSQFNPFQSESSSQKTSAQKSKVQAVNIYQNENKDELVVTAEVPGVKKEDISIEVKGDLLQFSTKEFQEAEDVQEAQLKEEGEKKEGEKKKGEKFKVRSQERTSKDVKREVKLPFLIDQEKVNANYENGILTIRLTRAEEDKPKKVHVL